MATLNPIYTAENCSSAYQLNWAVSVFPHQPLRGLKPIVDSLRTVWENDGIRILEFRGENENVIRFWLSTMPEVSPRFLLQRLKGRLQNAVRAAVPKAFRRNYRLESVGSAKRDIIESYVRKQTVRHSMADPRVQQRLTDFQIRRSEVDLSRIRYTAHGQFIYNLQVVLEHDGGRYAIEKQFLKIQKDTILAVGRKKSLEVSEAGMVANHLHLTVGCCVELSPQEVALCFLNNLAHAHGMKPIYRFGYYVGTFGNFDVGALRNART